MSDNVPMRRRSLWLVAVLSLPLGLTLWALTAVIWLGIWGGGNLVWAAQGHSLPALSRGVDGMARAVGVTSAALSGWGSLGGVIPPLAPLTAWGDKAGEISLIGHSVAPLLPEALGSLGPRRYLICALNDAELFGSGGAPLNVTVVEADQGRLSVVQEGAVSSEFNPNNDPYSWDVAGGLPWYREGRNYPFANSNFHPDFPVSGRNISEAWSALGNPDVDGVITVDMSAIAAALDEIGPVDSGEYGLLTSSNIVHKVLVDAYRDFPETVPGAQERRRTMNGQLREDLVTRVSSPRDALDALRGIWSTVPSRHVQAFMADPALQQVVDSVGLDAALATNPGDIVGAFIQSGPSKLAIFQKTELEHSVTIRSDGSALVRQDVSFTNAVPDDLYGDPTTYRGYLALVFRQRVAFRIPTAAVAPTVELDQGRPLVRPGDIGPFSDGAGASVIWQGVDIPPRQTRTMQVSYELPPGAFGSARQLRYRMTANPQATALPVGLIVRVRLEDGSVLTPEGWAEDDGWAQWRGSLDRTIDLDVDLVG